MVKRQKNSRKRCFSKVFAENHANASKINSTNDNFISCASFSLCQAVLLTAGLHSFKYLVAPYSITNNMMEGSKDIFTGIACPKNPII